MSSLILEQPVISETEMPQVSSEETRESPERMRWKSSVAATIGVVVLGTALATYGALRSPGKTEVTEARSPHTSTPVVVDPIKEQTDRRLQLAYYTREADEALILIKFYLDSRETDKLAECLKKLQQWKDLKIALHGVPRFTDADGLIVSRSYQEGEEKDRWERVNDNIDRLCAMLSQQTDNSVAAPSVSME